MILVTGASGVLGQEIVAFLLAKGVLPDQLAVLVRHQEKGNAFAAQGLSVRIGDYDHPDSLVQAFRGVEKLVFISGTDLVHRTTQHKNVVESALIAGVKQVIYTSFQRKNETSDSPLWVVAESHLLTEKWLKESGMGYTILKNNLYMDLIPAFVGEGALATQTLFLPAGDGRVGAVLRSELAEATAQVVVEPGHENQVYEFTHSSSFSYADIAQHLAKITDKAMTYVSPSFEEYAKALTALGVPDDAIGLFGGFAVAQAQGELAQTGEDITRFLGRKPTSIAEFLQRVYGEK